MGRNEAFKEFAEEVSIPIFSLATVSDNWMNQLKTYHNIKVEDKHTATMWFITMSMYIELLLARIDDLVDVTEQATIETECLKKVAYAVGVYGGSGEKNEEEKVRYAENFLREQILSHRKHRVKHDLTIPQTYTGTFVVILGEIMPEQFITSYVEMKIKMFEEENLRSKLHDKLIALR